MTDNKNEELKNQELWHKSIEVWTAHNNHADCVADEEGIPLDSLIYRALLEVRTQALKEAAEILHLSYGREWVYRRDFGGNRQIVLARDKYRCVKCSISRLDHFLKFGRDIAVDHIDRDSKNNSMRNLQTLCFSCHAKKDSGSNYKDRTKTSSRFKCVSWSKEKKKWEAYVRVNGKQKRIGRFRDEMDAHNAVENFSSLPPPESTKGEIK